MAQTPSTHRDVITVVRDPRHQLGKAIDTNGKKSSQVYLSLGIAKQHHVPNAEALAKLLKEIGDDSSAAIINSGFPDIPLGEEFLVMSEKLLRSKLNLAEDAPKPLGVHTVQHQGKNWKVVGRFKENVCASSWQLLDRDVDEHTPNEFSQLNHDEWLAKLESILPGLEAASRVADEDQERFFAWLKQKNPSVTKALFNKAITGAKLRIRSISVDKAAGARHKIMVREEDVTAMADEAEEVVLKKSPEGTLVLYGGLLARVQEAPPYGMHGIGGNTRTPPPQMVLRTLNQVDILSVLEQYVVFQKTILSGPKNVAVPGPVLDTLLRGARHKAPLVRGLVNHPLVLDGDRVINAPGLNPRSGLFYVGPAWSDLKPYSPHEAAKALSRISNMLFAEFQFKTTLDRDVALAMLFTAIQRRVLPIAPGFALLAHIQSSGKTTLARVIHLVTTGREMPVVSFPEGDETEAEKRVTSILMNAPSMVVLDNLTDGITFQSSTLARAITSPTIRGRILGESREIEAPTNTLWVLTGNNISLGADEATRWLPVWLDAQMVRPHQRQFKNTDLYSYILSVREQIIRDVIGIVWGYLKESRRQMSKTRFADWDLMVRQSLMWAGAHDVQDAVDHALAQSGTAQAEAAALTCLDEQFQNKPFFASDIIGQMPPPNVPPPEWASHLIEALGRLRCRDPRSPTSLGRALRALAGRPVETSRGILTLKASTKDGKTSYRVEQNAASL